MVLYVLSLLLFVYVCMNISFLIIAFDSIADLFPLIDYKSIGRTQKFSNRQLIKQLFLITLYKVRTLTWRCISCHIGRIDL